MQYVTLAAQQRQRDDGGDRLHTPIDPVRPMIVPVQGRQPSGYQIQPVGRRRTIPRPWWEDNTVTMASQQRTPWSGFNGFGGFGDIVGWTLDASGVWTAPDGTSGWARNPDGTFTNSVVDGLGNVIVYTVNEGMQTINTVTVPPGAAGDGAGGDWLTALSTMLAQVGGTVSQIFRTGTPSSGVTPLPAGGSWLNPGTWSLPMIVLIGGGVYWLVSSSTQTRTGHRSRMRHNPGAHRRRKEREMRARHLSDPWGRPAMKYLPAPETRRDRRRLTTTRKAWARLGYRG